jgi:hypothetical protein
VLDPVQGLQASVYPEDMDLGPGTSAEQDARLLGALPCFFTQESQLKSTDRLPLLRVVLSYPIHSTLVSPASQNSTSE